jgi:hypothetical protein
MYAGEKLSTEEMCWKDHEQDIKFEVLTAVLCGCNYPLTFLQCWWDDAVSFDVCTAVLVGLHCWDVTLSSDVCTAVLVG